MTKPLMVDANYRYIAAYQEVNARIVQRQQALILYATLVVSLLAALVALRSGNMEASLPVEWLLWGFPVASTCLVFLNYKTERAISHLRHFLSALEQLDNAHTYLPSYNTDPHWAERANLARRYQDWASAILVLGGNGIGLAAIASMHPDRIRGNLWVMGLTAAITIMCILALLIIPSLGYRSAGKRL